MLNVKSIREGNLFIVGDENIGSVEYVENTFVKFYGNLICNRYEDIKPIEITQQIAPLLGFKLDLNNKYTLRVGVYILHFYPADPIAMYFEDMYVDLKYIHQLQNFYFDQLKRQLTIDVNLVQHYTCKTNTK